MVVMLSETNNAGDVRRYRIPAAKSLRKGTELTEPHKMMSLGDTIMKLIVEAMEEGLAASCQVYHYMVEVLFKPSSIVIKGIFKILSASLDMGFSRLGEARQSEAASALLVCKMTMNNSLSPSSHLLPQIPPPALMLES